MEMEITVLVSNPKVSIICNTYNHVRFIKQALDSFLMQITNFEYEILIHDDASTDDTTKILKEYEIMYPNKFNIIYQKDNQYSKGISVNQINTSRSKGDYIAICEGDDYWLDPYKLQKQVDYLDRNPNCNLVVHSSIKKNPNNPCIQKKWIFTHSNRILTTEEIISNRGVIAAHNSFVYRNLEYAFPDFFSFLGVWDISRIIYFTTHGYVYYINELMSVYHVGISGSWNERVRLNDAKMTEHYKKEIEFYRNLNEYTKNKYFTVIHRVILELEYQINILKREYTSLNSNKYFAINQKFFQIKIQKYFPYVFRLLRFYRYKYWI